MWQRLKDLVVHKILGLDDAPQRIAWGVFLGFFVAMTPTLGLQIILYVAIATLFRVNKVAGVPILFISNPVTAVPLYGFCWWLGNLMLHGSESQRSWQDVQAQLMEGAPGTDDVWAHVLSAEFWRGVGIAMAELGGELWLGSVLLGVITGAPCYVLTLWGIRAYRRRSAEAEVDEATWSEDNSRQSAVSSDEFRR